MAHAPKTADEVKLTERTNGGWMKRIGKRPNGKPMEFYFSAADGETAARMKAWGLMKEWDIADASGAESWEAWNKKKEYTARGAEQARAYSTAAASQPKMSEAQAQHTIQRATAEIEFAKSTMPVNFTVQTGITIAVALAAYLKELSERIGATGSLGLEQATVDGIEYRINRALSYTKHTHLSELNFDNLKSWVLTIAKRPMMKANPNASKETQKAQTKKQISQSTALAFIRELKAFLIWASKDDNIMFVLPRKIDDVWNIRPEAEEKHYRTLTVEEFGKLWHGAINDAARTADRGKRRRLFLMLGLNCGFYFVDIVTTKKDNINENQFMWKLRRKTRKTNSKLTRTKWKLWPETLKLLEEYMGDISSITKNDIRLAWRRLGKSCGVKVPHSILRDTGAQFMERAGGRELSDMYLAHARGSVADSYSHPDWDKLTSALDRMYAEFIKPAIDAMPEVKSKDKKKDKPKQYRKAA